LIFELAMKFLQLIPFAALAAAQASGAPSAAAVTFSETPKQAVSFGISIPKGGGKDFIGRIVGFTATMASVCG
jgi:hypothetical protein